MAKNCVECDSKVGGLFFGRRYENCEDCNEYVCTKCYKEKDGKYYCQRCHRKSQSGCFIATACYGIESDEVGILRSWRDNSLLKNSFGKKFVKFYYHISPPIANFISDKPHIKTITRFGLKPWIFIVSR